MATSKFFSHSLLTNTNEHFLVQSMVDESIDNFGLTVQYLPRSQVNMDTILNDAEISKFDNAYEIEAHVSSAEGFGGTGEEVSLFGFEVRDTAEFIISRKRFTDVVTSQESAVVRPREGDVVYFPLSKQLFEITFVEDEQPFFQLGKNYVYHLSTALFRYEDQELDTGITEIDSIETDLAQQTILTLIAGGTGTFSPGETVAQTLPAGNVTAEVISWVSSTYTLTIINRSGNFEASNTIPLFTSAGASWFITTEDTNSMLNDPISDNLEFETEGVSVIDFTESNPFGEF